MPLDNDYESMELSNTSAFAIVLHAHQKLILKKNLCLVPIFKKLSNIL
jgi:hypothetical protein